MTADTASLQPQKIPLKKQKLAPQIKKKNKINSFLSASSFVSFLKIYIFKTSHSAVQDNMHR